MEVDENNYTSTINLDFESLGFDAGSAYISQAFANNGIVNYVGNTLKYWPDKDFIGADSITYVVKDGLGGQGERTMAVTVDQIINPPVLTSTLDPLTINEDVAFIKSTSSLFSDPDGDVLTYSLTGPDWLSIDPETGVLYGIPRNGNVGDNIITITATDIDNASVSTTTTITVVNHNDAPVSTPISPITVFENDDLVFPISGNFTDPDGDTLTYSITGGSWASINASTGVITGTPLDANVGENSLTITATDPDGLSTSQTVKIFVKDVNSNVVANDEVVVLSVNEDTTLNNIIVLDNDTDVDDGDTITVVSSTATNGVVVINADGTLKYTPNSNYNGSDTITYAITDGNGSFDTATVSITVRPVNDAPDSIAISDITATEDSVFSLDISSSFSDVDGDVLTYSIAGSSWATIDTSTGIITGTPLNTNVGENSLTVTATDPSGLSSSQTIAVFVSNINDAPIAVNDIAITTNEDTALDNIVVLDNDTDIDLDVLSVSSASASNGDVIINADGTLKYTPNSNYHGTDIISYTITDGMGGYSTSSFDVTVSPVNDAPTANKISNVITAENGVFSLDATEGFSDVDGDVLTYSISASDWASINSITGIITGTPLNSNVGPNAIVITATDPSGLSVSQTLTVFVSNVNSNVIANNDIDITVNEDESSSPINVLSNDTDPDGDVITIIFAAANNGTVVINADGTLTYTGKPNVSGNDTITYIVTDGNGGYDTATLGVAITPVNDAPVANTDTLITVLEDVPFSGIVVLDNDTDEEGDTLTVSTATAINGTVVINADGTLTYTSNKDYNGSDLITYIISDGNGGTDTSTVNVTVTPVADMNYSIFTGAEETHTLSTNSKVKFFDDDRNDVNKDASVDLGGFMISEVVNFKDFSLVDSLGDSIGNTAYNFDIDIQDVVVTLKHIIGASSLDSFGVSAGDLNLDGDVSIFDVVPTLKHMIGVSLIDSFGFIDQNGAAVESLTNGTEMQKLFIVAKGDVDGSGDWNAGYSELV